MNGETNIDTASPATAPPGSALGVRPLVRVSSAACLAVLACLVLSGCGEQGPGESVAQSLAATEAEALAKELGHRDRVRAAEHIAATEILQDPQRDGSAIRREPVSWSGRTVGSERATIDVRFVVTTVEPPGTSTGGDGNSAARATRCYRYLLQLYRYTSHQEIDCPSTTAAPTPSAAPILKVPADGRQRLTAALRTATSATLAQRVRAAFPEEHLTVDTITHQGALVAAVGVPAERDCLLLVRNRSGAIEAPGYDRIWLEPGETGCKTGLYVSPPR